MKSGVDKHKTLIYCKFNNLSIKIMLVPFALSVILSFSNPRQTVDLSQVSKGQDIITLDWPKYDLMGANHYIEYSGGSNNNSESRI